MNLLFFKSLISQEIIQAICWTLLHSLWQGLLLAIVGGIIVLVTKKSGSFLRYNLLAVLFLFFLIGSVATFLNELQMARRDDSQVGKSLQKFSITIQQPLSINASGQLNDKDQPDFLKEFIDYFNLHASLVVTIWLIIFSARFVRVVANLGYIQRVRHYRTHAPLDFWKNILNGLAIGLEIKRPIGLMESELIKVPIVIGFFKPLILVPFGLLAQLPMDQVEAILLHELAHIKRKDYLVNLLQSFSETIFFFNPAVLWISALIREERENCCDDIAIGKTNRKKDFIQALVSFQQYQESGPPFGIAFSRKNNHLLNRIKRIVSNHNNTLNNMEKIFLASAVILACVITLSFSQTNKLSQKPSIALSKTTSHGPSDEIKIIHNDTVPAVTEIDSTIMRLDGNFNGKSYRITQKNNKVIELWINGERIPEKELSGYQPLVDKITRLQIDKAVHAELKAQGFGLENERFMQKQKEIEDLSDQLAINQEELAREQKLLGLKEMQDGSGESANELAMIQEKLAKERFLELKANQDELLESAIGKALKDQELANQRFLEFKANPDETAEKLEMLERAERDIKANDLKLKLMELKQRDSRMKIETSKELVANQEKQIAALASQLEKKQISEIDFQRKLSKILEEQSHRIQANGLLDRELSPTKEATLQLMKERHEEDPIMKFQTTPNAPVDAPERTFPPSVSKLIGMIVKDLINEKIINSDKNISFELNNKKLIVNGRIQSDELHNKLKEKYINSDEDHFIFSNSGNGIHQEEVHTGKPKSSPN
jgi:bla regulator protein BlaR1